jgi:hypothetical protein
MTLIGLRTSHVLLRWRRLIVRTTICVTNTLRHEIARYEVDKSGILAAAGA